MANDTEISAALWAHKARENFTYLLYKMASNECLFFSLYVSLPE